VRVLLVIKAARPVGSCDLGVELKNRCETFRCGGMRCCLLRT